MPRRIRSTWPQKAGAFGERLKQLRTSRGFSQAELAEQLGISQRMIAYYELHALKAPAHLLIPMARALEVSTDELLGLAPFRPKAAPQRTRLMRKLMQIESLPAAERRAILKVIDSLLERRKAQ